MNGINSMKPKLLCFTLSAVFLSLAGCATKPISTSQAILVPEGRIHDRSYLKPGVNTGQVTVKRDGGIFGSACNTQVFANGKLTTELAASEKIVLYLPEGTHILSAWPKDPCGGGMVEVDARVRTDLPITFRVGYGSNGDFGLYPTAF